MTLSQSVILPDEPDQSAAPGLRESLSPMLQSLTQQAPGGNYRQVSSLEEFLQEPAKVRALQLWFGETGVQKIPRNDLARALNRDIARIDQLLTEQVNAILHAPAFQQLEGSWRGLHYLCEQSSFAQEVAGEAGEEPQMKIRVWNVSKRELLKDVTGATEFDQSQLFKKVYEEEFGMAGGEPYGVLLGDYQFTNHVEDIELLSRLAETAAAAFAPFISAPHPSLLGLEQFSTLENPINLESNFQSLDYLKWRALREREDSRFVGLVMPRVLMRVPYEDDGSYQAGFRFREDVSGPDRAKYLWSNAAYAFGAVLLRSYAECGWFADIRGLERGVLGGGLVPGLPVHSFSTDRRGVAPKHSTEIMVHEFLEKDLSHHGFIPLSPCKDSDFSVFLSNQSIQKAKTYDTVPATTNARLSAMLQYMLCTSRFAHYLKIQARNKIGGLTSEDELERFLVNWIHQYVAADALAPPDVKARYPLREAQVEVRELLGQPGSYRLTLHMLPHFQLDQLSASLKFLTRLNAPGR